MYFLYIYLYICFQWIFIRGVERLGTGRNADDWKHLVCPAHLCPAHLRFAFRNHHVLQHVANINQIYQVEIAWSDIV